MAVIPLENKEAQCRVCKETKEINNFTRVYKPGNLYRRLQNLCISCARKDYKKVYLGRKEIASKKSRETRYARKLRAIEYKGGKCEHCGQVYHHCAFDFHHVDSSTKKKDPGLMMKMSDEVLFKELDKCILLCANCHRVHHFINGY